MEIHLVGGAVRDLLLGRSIADKDYLVTGTDRHTFKAMFPQAREVGRAFPVFLLDGCEYAFPRAEGLDADLAARDFTVNAAAIGPDGELACHPHFLEDMHRRMLRPTSPDTFRVDPLRVFRAARFLAELPDFAAHPELIDGMREAAGMGLLEGLAPQRIARETLKALAAPAPGRFLSALHLGGALRPWFAELADADAIPGGPLLHHPLSVLEHTVGVMDRTAGDPVTAWMGMCHDLGKTTTEPHLLPRHIGHEERGEELARTLGLRLALPNEYLRAGMLAAKLHMLAARYAELRPGTRVDLLAQLRSQEEVDALFRLVEADGGPDILPLVREEFKVIHEVSLPLQDRNHGAASGEKLRDLRAQALAERTGR